MERIRVVMEGCFSVWMPEISGVPEESMLFGRYINNLDGNVGGMIRQFADNTKIIGVVDGELGRLIYYMIWINWESGTRNGRWNLTRTKTLRHFRQDIKERQTQ